jgi:hypothetical protein
MMREIKFRAWDKECGRMFFDLTIEAIINQTVDSVKNGHDTHWLGETDHVLMQYTGLHDVNGREIYEGDLVRIGDGKNTAVCPVEWKSDADWPSFLLGGNYFICAWPKCEIVGNIYETPELLT